MAEIVDFGLQQHKIKMDSRYFENVLSVVAGDTGRRIEVQLLDTNGMVQDTTGLNLRLNAEIAGKATFTDATLVDATTGKYQLDLSNGMFLAPGNWQFQWQITDSAGKKLHSFAFTGNIGKNISEGGSQATNFYLNLEDLKAMQDDLVNGTIDSSILETNITEKLTNLETQYAPKLTEVTAQLAQTVKKTDTLNMAQMGQDVKEAMTGGSVAVVGKNSVIAENIVNGAVTGEKIDNVSTVYQATTANIFNKNTSVNGGYFFGTSGAWITNELFASTGYMPVKPNKIYSFTSSSNYTFFDADFNYIGGGYGLKSSLTPTNAAYMSSSLTVANLNIYMVVEGEVLPTQYVAYIGVPAQYTFGEKWKFPENFIDDYKKLDEAMYGTFVDKEKTIDLDWVSGSMLQDGTLGANAKRVRSNVFKTLSSKINIIPLGNNQYDYLIGKYNMDGTFVSLTTTWVSISSSITVDTDYQYRLILRYSSDTEIIPNIVNSDVIVVEQTDIGKSVGLFEKIIEKKITEVSGEDYSSDFNKVNNFTVDVNVSESDVTSNSLEIQDIPNILKDNALLLLPDNYKTKGKPTQLIINCHGAGTNITSTTSTLSQPVPNLLKLGYAVLDVNGRPQDLPGLSGLHYGAPFALTSYLKAYKHVIENFNVTERVFVIGTSMGGLTSNMLVQSGSIPVIAQSSLCGVVDHFKQAWSRTWNVGQRQSIADYFNFEGTPPVFTDDEIGLPPSDEEQAYYLANIDKTIGFNPMVKNTYNWKNSYLDNYFDNVEEANYSTLIKHHNVPLKIWHNANDWTVQPRYSRYFVQAIRNAGGLAYYREFPTGAHNAWDNGSETTMKDINGIDFTVKATTYELYQWFKRFE